MSPFRRACRRPSLKLTFLLPGLRNYGGISSAGLSLEQSGGSLSMCISDAGNRFQARSGDPFFIPLFTDAVGEIGNRHPFLNRTFRSVRGQYRRVLVAQQPQDADRGRLHQTQTILRLCLWLIDPAQCRWS